MRRARCSSTRPSAHRHAVIGDEVVAHRRSIAVRRRRRRRAPARHDRLGGEPAGEQRLADALAGHHVGGRGGVADEQHAAGGEAGLVDRGPGSATPVCRPSGSAPGRARRRRAAGRAERGPQPPSCPGSRRPCRRAGCRSRRWPGRPGAGTTRRSRAGGRRRTTRTADRWPARSTSRDVLAEGVPLAEVAVARRRRGPCASGSTSRRRRRRGRAVIGADAVDVDRRRSVACVGERRSKPCPSMDLDAGRRRRASTSAASSSTRGRHGGERPGAPAAAARRPRARRRAQHGAHRRRDQSATVAGSKPRCSSSRSASVVRPSPQHLSRGNTALSTTTTSASGPAQLDRGGHAGRAGTDDEHVERRGRQVEVTRTGYGWRAVLYCPAMPLNPDAVGTVGEPVEVSWTSKEPCSTPSASAPGPTSWRSRPRTPTASPSACFPTFPVVVGFGGPGRSMGKIGTFNPAMLVHGQQSVTLHRAMPVEGTATHHVDGSSACTTRARRRSSSPSPKRVERRRAAVHDDDRRRSSAARAAGAATAARPARRTSRRSAPPTTRSRTRRRPTRRSCTGSPATATRCTPTRRSPPMGGFDRPILHGLCSYGFTGRALLHTLCGRDPSRFKHIEARFASPVLPGEALTIRRVGDRRRRGRVHHQRRRPRRHRPGPPPLHVTEFMSRCTTTGVVHRDTNRSMRLSGGRGRRGGRRRRRPGRPRARRTGGP